MPVVAELGTTDISIEDFLYLTIGDVIELNTKIDDPLILKVGDIPKFTAQPGKLKKKWLFKLLNT